jgi:hypothetical protein
MMNSELIIRTLLLDDCTIGQLDLLGSPFKCFTLELPWKNNQQNISCIKPKTYKYEKRKSPTLGWVIHILDVEGRTWIYIHAGNFTSQIKGCILVGQSIKDINRDGTPDVTHSEQTFNSLMDRITDTGTITIQRAKAA